MALLSYRTTTGLGAGTTPVTLSGFGFAPKAISFHWVGRTGTADGVSRGTQDEGWGFAALNGDRCVCAHDTDAAGTTAAQSAMRDDASIATVSGAGAIVGRAHVSTWGTDGITITIDAAFGVDLEVEIVAWGGNDVAGAVVGTTAAEPSATGTVDTTSLGLGAAPDAILLCGLSQVSGFSSPSQVTANSGIFRGHAVKNPYGTISNGVLANVAQNGATTTQTRNYSRNGDCIARYSSGNPSTTLDAFASVSAMATDQFTLNWGRVNATGVTRVFFYLAIKGGFWEITATQAQATDTSTNITVTSNFRPQGAMFFGSGTTTTETQGTATNSSQSLYGSAIVNRDTGVSSEGEMCMRDTNTQAGAVTSTLSNHSHCLAAITNGTLQAEMHTTAWGATAITCRMTTADASARRFHALVWGSQASTSPPLAFPGLPRVGPPPSWVNKRPPYIAGPVTTAGSTGVLAGEADGAATAAGTLTGAGALVGQVDGAATATGTLAGAGALAGQADGAGSATGTLAGAGALAGEADAAAAASATLTGAGALVGEADGAGSAAATATGAGALSGEADAAAGATGTLAGAGAISGQADASAGAAGTLKGAGALTGEADGAAAASGTLGSPGSLLGEADGAGSAAGTLLGAGALAGETDAAATGAGALAGLGGLTGTAAGAAWATATATGAGALAGSAAGAATATGTLTATGAFTPPTVTFEFGQVPAAIHTEMSLESSAATLEVVSSSTGRIEIG